MSWIIEFKETYNINCVVRSRGVLGIKVRVKLLVDSFARQRYNMASVLFVFVLEVPASGFCAVLAKALHVIRATAARLTYDASAAGSSSADGAWSCQHNISRISSLRWKIEEVKHILRLGEKGGDSIKVT